MKKLTLKELISKTKLEMSNCGYSDKTIYSAYSYIWVKLYDYNLPDAPLNEEVINDFFVNYFGKNLFECNSNHLIFVEKTYVRAMSMLVKVNNGISIQSIIKNPYIMNEQLSIIYNKYLLDAKNDGNCPRTIANKEKIIKLFISKTDFNIPSKENIQHYLQNLNNKKEISNTIDNRVILKFLILCYEKKYITREMLSIWPKSFPNRTQSNIPSEYSSEELKELLTTASIFKNEDCHLRNYAIICLITYTGLRASDVCNLKLNNIDWDNNQIAVVQQKTLKQIKFPLISQIGNPLIDYITKERVNTTIDNIFVTEKGQKLIPQIITIIINRYFAASNINIDNKHYGPHALRHSFASNLLNNGSPIYDVAKTLGHSDTRCISIYAKVNITNLRKCVLEDIYD